MSEGGLVGDGSGPVFWTILTTGDPPGNPDGQSFPAAKESSQINHSTFFVVGKKFGI